MSSTLWDNITGRSARLRAAQREQEAAALRETVRRQAKSLEHIRNHLRESTTTDHAAKLARTGVWQDLSKADGAEAITQARKAYDEKWADHAGVIRRFPYAKRSINMMAQFCFGPGLEAPMTGDEALDKALNKWWSWPTNQQGAFSMPSQHELSAQLLVDGCLMFAIFESASAQPMVVRVIDRLEFVDVVTHPEDKNKVLYYKRQWYPEVFDENGARSTSAEPRVLFYTDIDNREDDTDYDDPYAEALGERIARDQRGRPVRILRLKLNSLASAASWGNGIMLPLMDWELLAEEVAQDAATMSKASAALAIKLTIEGDETDVADAEAYWNQDGTSPTVGASNPGDLNIMNQAADLQVARAGTGADESYRNIRIFRQTMAVIGGWALHYLGDPENANLATTSSMELPILKNATAYQSLWTYVYTRLAREALRGTAKAEGAKITIPMPDLVTPDLLDRTDAIKTGEDAGWATKEQAATEFWGAMGAADVTAEVEKAMTEYEKNKVEMPNGLQPGQPGAVPWPPEGNAPPAGEEAQPNAPTPVRGGNPVPEERNRGGGP